MTAFHCSQLLFFLIIIIFLLLEFSVSLVHLIRLRLTSPFSFAFRITRSKLLSSRHWTNSPKASAFCITSHKYLVSFCSLICGNNLTFHSSCLFLSRLIQQSTYWPIPCWSKAHINLCYGSSQDKRSSDFITISYNICINNVKLWLVRVMIIINTRGKESVSEV